VEADAARAVHPVDEDRVAAVADRHPRGQLGLPGQVLDQRAAQVTERELPADDVTQPDQPRAERVARPGVRIAQIAERDQGPG
jgi:hypothetical protein